MEMKEVRNSSSDIESAAEFDFTETLSAIKYTPGGGLLMDWASKCQSAAVSKLKSDADDNEENHGRDMHILISRLESTLLGDQAGAGAVLVSGMRLGTGFRTANPQSASQWKSECITRQTRLTSSKYNYDYNEIVEGIWKFNDQHGSFYLQERLKYMITGEYEHIVEVVFKNIENLMVHKFGNFLVQCMLELMQSDKILHFAVIVKGRTAELSKDQFCCHVIQKLLDVSPLVVQARVAAELLDDIVATMTSPYGTHVWQKLFYLPWSPNLPSITKLANNAIHSDPNAGSWLAITGSEAGCATIKSYLSSTSIYSDDDNCIEELLTNIHELMVRKCGSWLVCKLVILNTTRARAMTCILSRAHEYCKHETASGTLIQLLRLKIPSFPTRLSAALVNCRAGLVDDKYGALVLAALDNL